MAPLAFIAVIVAYLIGSISNAILLCRVFKLPDPREYGSKNPGTTNVLRVAGKYFAITVLILDICKGFFTVWIISQLFISNLVISMSAVAVFLGQLFPIFFKFKGGKGIAVSLGIITAFYWQLSLLLIITWVLVFLKSKISSLAGLTATLVTILVSFWLPNKTFATSIMLISLLILFRHKQNIKNLFNKTEYKIKL
jgi:glycerol-3-phosphate acyltransferase PlsY